MDWKLAAVPFLAKLFAALSESFAIEAQKAHGKAGQSHSAEKNAPKEKDFLIEAFAVLELHQLRRTSENRSWGHAPWFLEERQSPGTKASKSPRSVKKNW